MKETNLRGVTPALKKDGSTYYRSSITHNGKHISLGSYDDPQSAHQAYWEAAIVLHRKSMKLSEYNDNCLLSYKKWVILINFRDNDIYITAPIYLLPNYFEYHLSPTEILKFSTDDLFYYSKKQIMKRGRHFFVADYGSQYNIMNRYGIRSYGVENRDYVFKNGDNLDFRYENIKIINKFNGVTSKVTKKGVRYTARIHILGNFTIGRYKTEEEAAIAYNKAIDILKKNGVDKAFISNYLDIPASKYAEIYQNVSISSKITAYNK